MSGAFETVMAEVQAFVAEHGRLPSSSDENGRWVSAQRISYKKRTLSAERVQDLESIPLWTWCPFEDAFGTVLAEVQAFAAEKGRLPSASDENGRWVNAQRTSYKKRKLPEERIQALEAIPLWTWSGIRLGC